MQEKVPLIMAYHADCVDGAAAAWAIAQSLPPAQKLIYVPYSHSDHAAAEISILYELAPGSEIYFVDVAPEKKFLDILSLHPQVAAVHVWDHHATAAKALAGYVPPTFARATVDISIDPARPSAALMTWEKAMPDVPAPDFLFVVDKMDGDAAGLKTQEDFAAAALIDTVNVQNIAPAFDSFRGLARMSFNEMAAKGLPTLKDQQNRIDALLASAGTVTLSLLPDTQPVSVPIVNSHVRYFGRMVSSKMIDFGKKSGSGVFFSFSVEKNGGVSISIRTDKTPDASRIAHHLCQSFGITGGGHAGAAAVYFPSMAAFLKHMPYDGPSSRPQQHPAPKA